MPCSTGSFGSMSASAYAAWQHCPVSVRPEYEVGCSFQVWRNSKRSIVDRMNAQNTILSNPINVLLCYFVRRNRDPGKKRRMLHLKSRVAECKLRRSWCCATIVRRALLGLDAKGLCPGPAAHDRFHEWVKAKGSTPLGSGPGASPAGGKSPSLPGQRRGVGSSNGPKLDRCRRLLVRGEKKAASYEAMPPLAASIIAPTSRIIRTGPKHTRR